MNYHKKNKITSRQLIKYLITLGLILSIKAMAIPDLVFGDLLPPIKIKDLPLDHTSPPGVSYLAFGELRGEIAPCGCDPRTDLGGLRRIAKFRGLNPNKFAFSLGNNFSVIKNEFKDELINQSLASLKLTAALPNEVELNMPAAGRNIDYKQIPYILSNAKNYTKTKFLRNIRRVNLIVYGFVSPTVNRNMLEFAAIRKKWADELKNQRKYRVLLFAGTDEELKTINSDHVFDEIISANTKPLTAVPNHEEKEKPGILLRMNDVYMVPSFGQGFLLGGEMRRSLSKENISKLLDERRTQAVKDEKPNMSFGSEQIFLWLTKEYEDSKTLLKPFKLYDDKVSTAYNLSAKKRIADLKNSNFTGAEACKNCHQNAYKAWTNSAHSHAFLTLKNKSKDNDPSCVNCHVLGLKAKGGFVSESVTPQFKNVQCESCHGPRKEHIANPMNNPKNKVSASTVCVECHHQPHSSNFQFDEYWPKIKHGI